MRERRLFLVVLFVLTLTSCARKPLFKESHYFQALGEEGQVVLTVDTRDLSLLPSQFTPLFEQLKRIDRLSLELYNPTGFVGDEEGLIAINTLNNYNIRGALEGRIPKFLTNTALLFSDDWKKVETDSIRYYHNENLHIDLYAPKSGLLLFSNGDFVRHYKSSYKERKILISPSLAKEMASSLFGLYLGSPQAMFDVGLNLPKSVLLQSKSVVMVLKQHESRLSLSGIVTMKSERLANSLSILLKSSYISEKRRNRESLGDLTNLFVLDGDAVFINDYPLTESQFEQLFSTFNALTLLATGE